MTDSISDQKIENTDKDKTELSAEQKVESIEIVANAGRYIGVLERYLTVVLIIWGQNITLAIGLTFTAKTLTRFSKITNEPDFAEKYLIGTLSSLLFAVIGAFLCK